MNRQAKINPLMTKMHYFRIPFSKLELPVSSVFNEFGYESSTPDIFIIEEIQHIFDDLLNSVVTSCVFSIFEGESTPNSIKVNDIVFDTGPIIASQLKHADRFALFIATAGHEFEHKIQHAKNDNDLLRTLLMDMIGNCIVEKTGDLMEKFLEREIPGLEHTYRFSPGYCNWKLTEQRKIFRLLPDNPCEVSLSKVCLMKPIKSISGIIGIGENVKRKQYACKLCQLENCYKRKSVNQEVG